MTGWLVYGMQQRDIPSSRMQDIQGKYVLWPGPLMGHGSYQQVAMQRCRSGMHIPERCYFLIAITRFQCLPSHGHLMANGLPVVVKTKPCISGKQRRNQQNADFSARSPRCFRLIASQPACTAIKDVSTLWPGRPTVGV